MKHKSVILAFLVSFVCLLAQAADFTSALQSFNRDASAGNANSFFTFLLDDGFLDEPIAFSEGTSRDSLCAAVWYWSAEYYYDKQDYRSAAQYGEQSLPLCERVGDKTMEADCASLLGLIYVRLGDFDKAAVFAKHCNRLDIESGNNDNIASSYNTLAGIYMSMRQPDEAEKYILQAIKYVKQADNPVREAVIYGMASEVYQHKNMPYEALDYATRAWKIETSIGRPDKAAIRQTQRAAALTVLERYDEAEQCLLDAIPQIEASGNMHSLAIAYNQMGDLLYVTGRNKEGADYYYKALPIFVAQHDIYNEAHTQKGLRETLRGIAPEAALKHGDRFEHLRDSIYDRESQANLSQFAAEFENDILQRLYDKQRRNYIIIISLIIFMFVISAILTFVIHKRRQNRQVEHFNNLLLEVERLRKAEKMKNLLNKADKKNSKEEVGNIADDELFLARVVEYVNNALPDGDISVEAIAYKMCMSVSTFRRRMIAITGEPPKNFIFAIQMDKAKNLLSANSEQPDSKSINDIAYECGFKETNSFIRAFQRFTGKTPTKWRS